MMTQPQARPARKWARESSFRLLAVGLGVLAGGVVAELLARRILGPTYGVHVRISEQRVFARHGASFVGPLGRHSYDDDGFRRTGPEVPHEYKVLFIGDSFTEGDGVDDEFTFAAVAQQRLAERGIRIRSLNAGIVGVGTAQELRLLRRLLERSH